MRSLFILLFVFSPLAALAQPRAYQIDMKVVVEGHEYISPRVIVNEGKEAEIGESNTSEKTSKFIKVKADRVVSKYDNQVKVQATVEVLENGERKVIASPQIIALENERASIEIKNGGKQSLVFSALVSRVH